MKSRWYVFYGVLCAGLVAALSAASLATKPARGTAAAGPPVSPEIRQMLTQISADNISRLGVAWSYEIPFAPPTNGNAETHQEGTPLVFNGVLYGITPWSARLTDVTLMVRYASQGKRNKKQKIRHFAEALKTGSCQSFHTPTGNFPVASW